MATRETVSKLSKPRHQSRNFHHQVHHGRNSGCSRQVNIARRMKRIIRKSMFKQHTLKQSLHAFNQSLRSNCSSDWAHSAKEQGRAGYHPFSSASNRYSDRFHAWRWGQRFARLGKSWIPMMKIRKTSIEHLILECWMMALLICTTSTLCFFRWGHPD